MCFLFVAALGFGLRMHQLGARPMHTDEAVNAYVLGQTLAGHPFHYDAKDRHGPALAALALPLVRLQGARSFADLTEAGLRLTPVLAGTLTLLLFGAAVDIFGFAPCLIAAALTAVAPLPLYYDRYFIHEPLLAAATLLLLLAACGLWSCTTAWRAALAGAAIAMMLATKETAVLNLTALAIAGCCSRFWLGKGELADQRQALCAAIVAAATFLLIGIAFYSWFGRDWHGLRELLRAIPRVLSRVRGEGHQKPFWYYLQLLASGRSGLALSCLAVTGAVLALRSRTNRGLFALSCYGLTLVMLYSVIPYKTPWLALTVWVPFALLAGFSIDTAFRRAWATNQRRLLIPVLVAACLTLTAAIRSDTRRWVYVRPADEDNPYAYAHTGEDLLDLPAGIDRLAQERSIASPRIAVIAEDPWPLPWYLRHLPGTGYFQPGQDPGSADFYITSTEAVEQYQAQLHNLRPEFFGVRPGVLILVWSRDRAQP
jgi:uncharacterized protein (TIGR03663 family)